MKNISYPSFPNWGHDVFWARVMNINRKRYERNLPFKIHIMQQYRSLLYYFEQHIACILLFECYWTLRRMSWIRDVLLLNLRIIVFIPFNFLNTVLLSSSPAFPVFRDIVCMKKTNLNTFMTKFTIWLHFKN